MKLSHNILPKHRKRTSSANYNVDIELYPIATELYNELASKNYIKRIQEVPQLGAIKVSKSISKSRYDYAMLQLYLHQLVRKHLNKQLEKTYSNRIYEEDFIGNLDYRSLERKPTFMDAIQVMTLSYNVGHFYDTFVTSRACVELLCESETFYQRISNANGDQRFTDVVEKIRFSKNYYHYHLINTLLVLENCDTSLFSVKFAKELIYSYILNENKQSRLHYAFELFKKIRNVSYMAYDLQIANLPLVFELDEESVTLFLREYLSYYNNTTSIMQLVNSTIKMLENYVYNEPTKAITLYDITEQIKEKIIESNWNDYFTSFVDHNSVFNNPDYHYNARFSHEGLLKITFSKEEFYICNDFINRLSHMNNIKFGYYDRRSGCRTVIVSIKNSTVNKAQTAFRVLKETVGYLRRIDNISDADTRYLLTAKFFLFYFFGSRRVTFNETVNKTCVICNKGKNQRIKAINRILKGTEATADQIHEVEFMKKVLSKDTKSDTSLTIPSSIVVYNEKDELCEIDGMILYPNRRKNNVVFLEAKNTSESAKAKPKLIRKLKKLSIQYEDKNACMSNHDASITITI